MGKSSVNHHFGRDSFLYLFSNHFRQVHIGKVLEKMISKRMFKVSSTGLAFKFTYVLVYIISLYAGLYTLQETNISHLGKRKIIFKHTLGLVPRRV